MSEFYLDNMIWTDELTGIRYVEAHGSHRPCYACDEEREDEFERRFERLRKVIESQAILADRAKLAGVVAKTEAWTREDVDDRLIVLPKEDDGYYYPRENVLELIRTTPIGDGE